MATLAHNDTPHTNYKVLRVFLAVMGVLWLAAIILALAGVSLIIPLFLGYVGVFIGLGLGLFLTLPDRKRDRARRLMMVMVGGLLLLLAFVTDHGNMQIEGLFFAVLVGGAPFILLHFALAKIIGPLAIGRVWCGWACWYAMLFDLLPYPHSRYRIPGPWGWLRYAHFGASLLVVALLVFSADYSEGGVGQHALLWFVAGLLTYYVVGVALALLLKDNRAFCKYLCPIAVPLKLVSRFSLLKIGGTPEHCGDCEACVEMCPMNIRVRDYITEGKRVLSTECTLCLTCMNVCPHNSLAPSLGFDLGGEAYIDYEPPKKRRR